MEILSKDTLMLLSHPVVRSAVDIVLSSNDQEAVTVTVPLTKHKTIEVTLRRVS